MFCNYCGKQLPDESRFCPNCGATLVEEQPQYEQPVLDKAMYEQPQMNYYQQNMSTPTYPSYNGGYNDEYAGYKRRVRPFKGVAGAMNLISLIPMALLSLALIGAAAGKVDGLGILKWNSSLSDSLVICGVIGLVSCILLFVLSIAGFIAPAKAGVICNLIATIVCVFTLVYAAILNSDVASLGKSMGRYNSLLEEFSVGLYIFIFVVGFFQLVSLIMCLVGLGVKRNK